MLALKPPKTKKPEDAHLLAQLPVVNMQGRFDTDKRYFEALQKMQRGTWHQVVPLLRTLAAAYPKTEALEQLLSEALLQAELESIWQDDIKGRTLSRIPRWLYSAGLARANCQFAHRWLHVLSKEHSGHYAGADGRNPVGACTAIHA